MLLALVIVSEGGAFTGTGVFTLHILLFWLAGAFLIHASRSWCRAHVVIGALLFFALANHFYLYALLTEWVSGCLLLMLLGAILRLVQSPTVFRGAVTGGLMTALALIRAEYMVFAVLLTLLAIGISFRFRGVACGFILGVLPTFFWCSIVFGKTGSFAPAPMEGHLSGLALTLGPLSSDTVEILSPNAVTELNQRAHYVSSEDLWRTPLLINNSFVDKVNHNLGLLAAMLPSDSWHVQSKQMRDVALQAIAEHPFRYLTVVVAGAGSLFMLLPMLGLLCIRECRKKRSQVLFITAVTCLLLHAARICVIALVNIVHTRYVIPSLMMCATSCVMWWFSSNEKKTSRVL